MRPDLQTKLLELTRHGRKVTLDELARELRTEPASLVQKLERLREDGLVSFREKNLELDTRQRLRLAEKLVHNGRDAEKVSRLLEWQEFEDFAVCTLEENGFRTVKHLVFKSRLGRREIDILAWNDTFLLAIDCKHWLRGLSIGRMKDAAQAQVKRINALAERPEILSRNGVDDVGRRSIMPAVFSLGDSRQAFVDGVPIVSVSKLMSFLYGISPVDERVRSVRVKESTMQLRLK